MWSVAPTHEEFESCQGRLKQRLEERLAELDRPKVVESALSLSSTVETPAEVSLTTGDIPTEAEPMETGHSSTAEDQQLNKSEVLQLNCSTDDSGSRVSVPYSQWSPDRPFIHPSSFTSSSSFSSFSAVITSFNLLYSFIWTGLGCAARVDDLTDLCWILGRS